LPARGTKSPKFLVRIFGHRPLQHALLVAHLDPAQIEHRIGHRDLDALALAGALALIEGGEDARDIWTPVPLSRSARR